MKEIGTTSEIADIYSIYTGYSFRKIVIAVTVATLLMIIIWSQMRGIVFSIIPISYIFPVHYIIWYLMIYIKGKGLSEIHTEKVFNSASSKKTGRKFFRCIPQIEKISRIGYIVNHFVTIAAVIIAVIFSSAFTGKFSCVIESFNLFISYFITLTVFTFIRGIQNNAVKILCMIVAGVGAFIFSVIIVNIPQIIILILFIVSAAATPLALRTAINITGKEYV